MADDMKENEEEERLMKHTETDFSNGALSTDNLVSNETQSKKKYEESCEGDILLYSVVVLLEVVGVVCIILVCVWTGTYMNGFAWDGSGKMFNWHPVLMTLGLVFFYGNAAIIYRVLRNTEKFTVKLIHGGLHGMAFFCAVLGLYAVFQFHNHLHIPNVYSLHSWVGITTVVLYACQLLFGCLGFLYPRFSDNGRKLYLGIHVYFGGIIFALVIIACISGITEKMLFQFKASYSKFPPVGLVANVFGSSLILFGMLVGYILHNREWKRVE